MIIRIQASGGSFRGAGKYYLHDKLKEGEKIALRDQGDERVWFTDTRNTLNVDPERALDEMWRTAESQAYLKMQAGVRRGGRVCEDPVKTISLSWHKDDRPTPEHMVDSADAFLKHMGWDQHQAVMIGHNDTEHRHIHIVLNRVHGETGRTLDDYREQKRAQVWALAYEKEHEQLRCEQREIRAAKRENRAPELERHQIEQQREPGTETTREARQIELVAANDHLPHNVVMLARPHERAGEAADRQRADELQALGRAALKAEQRAEREGFIADGRKLFKAARHAAYDEVRKEFAPEWREFYRDREAAEKSAEAWSRSAITRAAYFARDGRFEEARAAFSDRDSVRDVVAAELAERKADLKERQTEAVRTRQDEVCLALRETREQDYQELLQRQRDERAALKAGHTLEEIGRGADRDAAPPQPVNQNEVTDRAVTPSVPASPQLVADGPTHDLAAEAGRVKETAADHVPEISAPVVAAGPEAPEVTRQLSDLAAGAIGSAASYLADQLGEMFAPTPPEVREAQAKAEAKREAEKPAPAVDDKGNAYARQIEAAMRVIEEERRQQERRAYWEERDRGKGFERDQ
jgi:hypothetical protein